MASPDPWIPFRRPVPDARTRLFCFAFAGGGASVYRGWSISNVEVCPVQLPGRENRIREAAFQGMKQVADAAADALARYDDMPRVYYGHSLGALIAFETALRLTPELLIAGGCPAPHMPRRDEPISDLPEPDFLRSLSELDGIPELIRQDREMMAFYSPILRADFTVYETYRPAAPGVLSCPVTAFAGDRDPLAPAEDMNAWQQVATGFRLRTLPGGHFFLRESEPLVVAAIADEIARRSAS